MACSFEAGDTCHDAHIDPAFVASLNALKSELEACIIAAFQREAMATRHFLRVELQQGFESLGSSPGGGRALAPLAPLVTKQSRVGLARTAMLRSQQPSGQADALCVAPSPALRYLGQERVPRPLNVRFEEPPPPPVPPGILELDPEVTWDGPRKEAAVLGTDLYEGGEPSEDGAESLAASERPEETWQEWGRSRLSQMWAFAASLRSCQAVMSTFADCVKDKLEHSQRKRGRGHRHAAFLEQGAVVGWSSMMSTLSFKTKDASPLKRWSALIVNSAYFDYLVSTLLVLSSLTMGVSVDYEARHLSNAEPVGLDGLEVTFCVLFACELGLRMYVERWAFFQPGPELGWNCFDSLVVVCQICEETTSLFVDDSRVSNFVRFIRALRILRVMRVVRLVRFVSELRKLVYLIMASFWSFIWTVVLLSMVTYIAALFFTQIVTFHRQQNSTEESSDLLTEAFGSLGDSIHTLYQSLCGGLDWGSISNALVKDVSMWFGVCFILYISFAVLVLLNLATGVFVDGAMKLSQADREVELVKRVEKVFQLADGDSKGKITLEQFKMQCRKGAVVDIFRAIEMNVDRAEELFLYLDDEGRGAITAEQFIVGALNLQGPAKALDFALLAQQQRASLNTVYEMLRALNTTAGANLDLSRCRPPPLKPLRSKTG